MRPGGAAAIRPKLKLDVRSDWTSCAVHGINSHTCFSQLEVAQACFHESDTAKFAAVIIELMPYAKGFGSI